MVKSWHYITVLTLVAALAGACASTPTPTPSPTPVPLAPTALPPTSTSSLPTVTPTSAPPTPTALPATATPPPPTPVPPEEDVATDTSQENSTLTEANRMQITIGDTVLTAKLVDNSSVAALKEALAEGPLTVNMRDYGDMEKVGPLGMELPRNDEQITTEAGDIILFQGSALVIYYAPNSWNFTRLGKVDSVTAAELKEILGEGNVTLTLSLPQD